MVGLAVSDATLDIHKERDRVEVIGANAGLVPAQVVDQVAIGDGSSDVLERKACARTACFIPSLKTP
jgi:hypothetical protein